MKQILGVGMIAVATLLAGCITKVREPEPIAMTMHCGALTVSAVFSGEELTLDTGQERISMRQAISASGARYVEPGDESTSFWNKGNTAQLRIKDKPWPQCVAAGTLAEPFKARGNEPFWAFDLDGGTFSLDRPGAAREITASYVQNSAGNDILIDVENQNRVTDLRISQQLCHDSMSGMVYPYSVRMTLDSEPLAGCGGDPKRLLQGEQWRVVSLDGNPVVADSEITINFVDDGLIAGSASCNWYSGQYQVKGDGLGISELVSTRRACQPPLMEQEAAFLKKLPGIDRFDFNSEGQLLLLSRDAPVAVARKSGY
ncbi:MAG: META domain-containing protein [Porticoccaceae bacterium]